MKKSFVIKKGIKGTVLALLCLFLVACEKPLNTVYEKTEESAAESAAGHSKDSMEVHYLDVGQADATLIKVGDKAMLIDAGDDTTADQVCLYMKKQGMKKLDYLVLTHTDWDHIGGADEVIDELEIGQVFLSDVSRDQAFYRDVKDALSKNDLSCVMPSVGEKFTLGDASFTILAPNRAYEDTNNSSIALLLEHGQNSFMFTGDAKEDAESDILANGLNLDCDVYKAGHHGSYSSSNPSFLEAMTPEYAVISCGKDNDYGYPHREVLEDFHSRGIRVYRTDEQGTVIAISDGTEIIWEQKPFEMSEMTATGMYAVNRKNGKIHKVGACEATGSKDGTMSAAAYFETYEEAEAYSLKISPEQERRKCGKCW